MDTATVLNIIEQMDAQIKSYKQEVKLLQRADNLDWTKCQLRHNALKEFRKELAGQIHLVGGSGNLGRYWISRF